MEYVSCDLCGSEEQESLFTARRASWTANVVRCMGCGLAFNNPRLDPAELSEYYQNDEYFSQMSTSEGAIGRDYVGTVENNEEARGRIDEIERFAGHGVRFLEIGCAAGANLVAARSRGWTVTGVEISEFASRFASERLGLNIVCGTVHEAGFDDSAYDAIGLFHVLEHVGSPSKLMREVRRILAPKGIVSIEVPDFGSRVSQTLRADWTLIAPPEHIYHFSGTTLGNLLEATGFQVVRTRRLGGVGPALWNSVVVHRGAEGLGAKLFNARRLVYRSDRLKRAARYLYWHVLRNNNYIRMTARKM